MALDLSNLNNLDFKSIGTWPLPAKAGIIGALCAVVLASGYFLHIKNLQEQHKGLVEVQQKLLKEFEEKQKKAVALAAYKEQMKEMEESFGTMLRQLPSKTQVPDLLVDITQKGLAAGLAFDLFKPERETPREFYAELPITINVAGDYHGFGNFVSGVAALPRIVTLENVSIKRGTGDKKDQLIMAATAKTYRYLDPDEIDAANKAAAAAKKKGKKPSGKK